MKRYILTETIHDGENEYSCKVLVSAEAEDVKERVSTYFKDFFGEDYTRKDGFNRYWEGSDMRCVEVGEPTLIPESHYRTLKKYLPEI
jgi:hypothetical protein